MGRIVQFGTSRFLQAHVDLFVHEARETGQDVGPITVVKTTAAGPRDSRVRAFGRPSGYQVIIRGLVDGAPLERTVMVHSVDRGISAQQDWRELSRLLAGEVDLVVCNTGMPGMPMPGMRRRRPGVRFRVDFPQSCSRCCSAAMPPGAGPSQCCRAS